MKTFKGIIIGLIIGIVATFAFAYTCMDSYFAMVMEKIHSVVQVFDNDNTSSSANYDDLTIDEKVALLDEGEASTDENLMISLSIEKDEILTQNEELYYVIISFELSAVHLNYIELMKQDSEMPKIYYFYDQNDEISWGSNNVCENVTNVDDLQCMYSMITVRNGVAIECTELDEEKGLDRVEVYDLKIKEIYRNYLENKKDS